MPTLGHPISMHAIKNITRVLFAWLSSGRFLDLVSTRHHSAYLTRHRLDAFVTRIRLVSIAFSALTLIWIALDAAAFETKHWVLLAACRIFASLVFIVLATAPVQEPSRLRALSMFGIMLAMPLSLYVVSQLLLAGAPPQGLAAINNNLYRALPLVVLAGLSIFPLVASEGLFFAAVIASVVAGIHTTIIGENAIELLSTLWVLTLALGVYLLGCAIQLHYMMALLRRASHDPLTGALTRRSGVEVLDLHFGLACDQGEPLSLLFIDADNFKSINDNFGHDAGDKALKEIAARLHALLRQADTVIRWGGEEFVVILTNTPMKGAELVIKRIINDWLGTRPDGAPLTVSMGIAERQTDDVSDWPQLVALADQRMYAAKTSGKACCVNHEGVMSHDTQNASPSASA
jgi:diguanylate cyclase (GGDEF)-like protein